MSGSHSNFSRGRFLSGLFIVAFSLTVLFLMLNQVPSFPVARGAVRVAANSTTFVETPTFQPQPTVVVIVATTATTATSLSTLLSTTTRVDTSTSTRSLTETVTTTSVGTSTAGLVPGLDPSLNIPVLVAVLIIGVLIGTGVLLVTKGNVEHSVGRDIGRPGCSPRKPPPRERFCEPHPPPPQEEAHWCNPDENCGPTGTHPCYPNEKSTPHLKQGERLCSKCGRYKVVGVNCAGCGKLEADCSCGGPVGIAVSDPGVPSPCFPDACPPHPWTQK